MKVLFFVESWRNAKKRADGVLRYAREHGWDIQAIDAVEVPVSPERAVAHWRPDGCIVDGDMVRISPKHGIPVVHCDADPRKFRRPYWGVAHDPEPAVRLAVAELAVLDPACYAFAGFYERRGWSRARERLFRATVPAGDASVRVFSREGTGLFDFHRRLEAWLAALPRPCGILAANDRVGELVLLSCRTLGIAVPEDVAVVGMDDDDLVCESTTPALTSVCADFAESGYLAAGLLDDILAGKSRAPEIRTFGTSRIVRRGSTRKAGMRNPMMKRVLEFIRLNACEGISVGDVVRVSGTGRRTLELRFRALSGRTIAEEIRAVRFARACELLRDPGRQLDAIGSLCGYGDYTAFRKFFAAQAGATPGEWRKRHAGFSQSAY